MFYKTRLQDMKKQMEEMKADISRQLAECPDGCLLIYEKRGKRYYCQRFPKKGNRKKEHRVSVTGDSDMIFSLVRKQYLEKALAIAEKNIGVLEKAVMRYCPINEESVMAEIVEKYPELYEGIFFGLRNSNKWMDEHVYDENLYKEDLKSVSSQGEKMRSGGEMYIASRLDHYGIPYRYEAATGIPDIPYVPDFTILRPRDRKVIFWEHFGMINDAEYVRKNIVKVSDYIDYGIRPWDNLIITYNNEMGGFNGKEIDAMIESRLLY